ncbi:MAG: hypothetical protein AAB288_12070, partial [Acidobacteriota bacterium]
LGFEVIASKAFPRSEVSRYTSESAGINERGSVVFELQERSRNNDRLTQINADMITGLLKNRTGWLPFFENLCSSVFICGYTSSDSLLPKFRATIPSQYDQYLRK